MDMEFYQVDVNMPHVNVNIAAAREHVGEIER